MFICIYDPIRVELIKKNSQIKVVGMFLHFNSLEKPCADVMCRSCVILCFILNVLDDGGVASFKSIIIFYFKLFFYLFCVKEENFF